MSITTTLTAFRSQDDGVVKKIQPRSSSERDNSILLHSALKAASNDMAHQLLNYASLDKMDCEASCILIALSNHSAGSRSRLINKQEKVRGRVQNDKGDNLHPHLPTYQTVCVCRCKIGGKSKSVDRKQQQQQQQQCQKSKRKSRLKR
jgi:hypothetical protein